MASHRSNSLCDTISKAVEEYQAKIERGEPPSDRVLAVIVCIRIEDFFIEKVSKLLKRPDADSIRAFSTIWNRLTGDDQP